MLTGPRVFNTTKVTQRTDKNIGNFTINQPVEDTISEVDEEENH